MRKINTSNKVHLLQEKRTFCGMGLGYESCNSDNILPDTTFLGKILQFLEAVWQILRNSNKACFYTPITQHYVPIIQHID